MDKKTLNKIYKIKNRISKIELCGGKCFICDETNPYVLGFHHKDPEKKSFKISDFKDQKISTKVLNELEKCELICHNCHYEIHSIERINNSSSNRFRKNKNIYLDWYGDKKCQRCGYDKCLDSLEFHHLRDKKFMISRITKTNINDIRDFIQEEIDKCELLCSNCHKIEHSDYKFYLENKEMINCYKIKKISKKIDRNLVINMISKGIKQSEIAKNLGVSKSSISGIVKEINS